MTKQIKLVMCPQKGPSSGKKNDGEWPSVKEKKEPTFMPWDACRFTCYNIAVHEETPSGSIGKQLQISHFQHLKNTNSSGGHLEGHGEKRCSCRTRIEMGRNKRKERKEENIAGMPEREKEREIERDKRTACSGGSSNHIISIVPLIDN